MANRDFVLCRRETADFGDAPNFCAKPITTPNDLNWCDACRVRLPFWPTEQHLTLEAK